MNELVLIGLGLYDEKDMSLRGLETLKDSETVFAEMYTSLMPGLSIQNLEEMIGKSIFIITRKNLEEELRVNKEELERQKNQIAES